MKLIDFIARGRGTRNRRAAGGPRSRNKRTGSAFFLFTPRNGLWALLLIAATAAIWSFGGRDASKSKETTAAPAIAAAIGMTGTTGAMGATAARPAQNPDKDALPLAQMAAKLGPLPKPAKAYHLAAILPYYGDEYWQILARGMQSRAMELGISIEMPAAASPADTQGELNLAMRELDRGCDALLLAPANAAALAPAVARAKAAHVPVLCLGEAEPIASVPLIGPSQYETGARAAQYFLEQFPKGAKILVVAGDLSPIALRMRLQGLTEALARSKVSIADTVQAGATPAETVAAFNQILTRHPDITGVYCTGDALALAVAQALASAGKAHAVRVVGSGGESRAYDAIREDDMAATVDPFAYINGQAAVDGAVRLLAGQILPPMIATPQNCITIHNLNDPLPAGASY
jgi:ribose transport system substrate-binding protein